MMIPIKLRNKVTDNLTIVNIPLDIWISECVCMDVEIVIIKYKSMCSTFPCLNL